MTITSAKLLRAVSFLALVTFLLVAVFTAIPSPASGVSPAPAIFFTPHQDDETLSMGASIKSHLREGRKVIVVLLTTGQNSKVQEKYKDEWPTKEAFVAERDAELINAMKKISPLIQVDIYTPPKDSGVTGVNGRIQDGGYATSEGKSGELTVARAKAAMLEYKNKYPNASFKTMSDLDSSRDHANAGIALRQLLPSTRGVCKRNIDARYYLKYEDRHTLNYDHWTKPENVINALEAYRPIGWLSVGKSFVAQKSGARWDPKQRSHKDRQTSRWHC